MADLGASTNAIRTIASAAAGILRAQALQANGGKERFGDWHGRLAAALEGPIYRAMVASLRTIRGGIQHSPAAQQQARLRATVIAQEINDTTAEWLDQGRDPFTRERALLIGRTEAVEAKNSARSLVARDGKRRLRWKVGSKYCADCKSLAGQTVKPGQYFRAASGAKVKHPPLHPNCDCEVEIV